ncbi:MAG: RNA methyltransferase [Pseudonocardiaceae bacterium]
MTTRNARFQQWQASLSNRTKRQRSGEFLVHGVRPVSLAVKHGWPIRALLYNADTTLSGWASDILRNVDALRVAMAPELLQELGGKADETPELIAVAGIQPDTLSRIGVDAEFLGVVFDRPTSPGNIGSLVRSVDAFGGHGVIVTGHAADPYDPKAIRGSTGSLFAVPVVRVPAHRDVLEWVSQIRGDGVPISVVGTDEHGDTDIADHDFRQPTLVVVGNETTGMSAGWREACDHMVRIPMSGSASSLNAANAGTVVLYEAARQRAGGR